jgi:antitoxin MazE
MQVQVQRWGNSLALRIPKPFAAETHIRQGAVVDLAVEQGRLVMTPVREAAYSLEELLAGITEENLHGETDWGAPVGNEVW